MKFIQIIEYTTTKPDEVQAALDEFLAATEGKRPNTRASVTTGPGPPEHLLQHRRVPVVRRRDEELRVAGESKRSPRR